MQMAFVWTAVVIPAMIMLPTFAAMVISLAKDGLPLASKAPLCLTASKGQGERESNCRPIYRPLDHFQELTCMRALQASMHHVKLAHVVLAASPRQCRSKF